MSTFTREFLQTYKQKAQAIAIREYVIKEVLRSSLHGQTRYVYPYIDCQLTVSLEEFIQLVKEKLPGVTVEYRDATNLNGIVERGIVIDWA